jgi:hypothetical protein
MQMDLFNEPKYQVHREFMFLLYAAKVLINDVVLPKIVHIFGNAERKPHRHQQQPPESRAQRVRTLALTKRIVEPQLKHLADWERHYSQKCVVLFLHFMPYPHCGV